MNEMNNINLPNLTARCQTCLGVTKVLYTMSPEIENLYGKFVQKIENTKQICKICQYMFKKFIKFINSLCRVSEILENGIDLETNSLPFYYPTLFSTNPDVHYLGPDSNDDTEVQDDCDFTNYDDDDELPLVKLRSSSGCETNRRSKKRKKNDQLITNIEEVKDEDILKQEYESIVHNVCENDPSETAKAGPEGFTTRMVRETTEYVVIKLTKDQVLQEMVNKSKTDVYIRAPYKCEKCVKGFNFEDVLASHMVKHTTENGMYLCEICNQYCPSPVSLRGHMKSHTTRYKCKVCGHIRLSRQHLMEHHAITHTSSAHTYTCVSCHFTTNKRTVIQRHVKTTHSSKETHTCHHCGKMFKTVDSLRVHSVRHDKSRRYQCSQCGKTFIYPSLLYKHVQVAHEREDCYCVECDIKFKSPETLRLHFKRAKKHRDSSSYKFVCNECPERFVSPSALAVHSSSSHGVAKQHWCNVCGKAYSSREVLRAHVWRTHAQTSRPLPSCPLCHKTFSRKSIVTAHMRTHTGERPYACECGAAFAQRATLRAHVASKHRQEKELAVDDKRLMQNPSLEQ